MAYKPSLEDLSESSSYTPSLEDLDDEPKSASQAILSQIEESQQAQPQQQRTPQMQEEFSNPTMWPGFSDLPKEEQLRRIAYSQFDPANEASGGRYVPGGTYESDPARMMASVLPTLAVPELRAGWPVVRGLANALTRVGAGTLGNIAYQAPNIKSKEDLVNVAIQSGALNALLEGATWPLRGAARLGELFNPINFTKNKLEAIKSDYQAARVAERAQYQPVMNRYGDSPIDLKKNNQFIDAFKEYSDDLGTNVNKMQKKYIKEPTIQNAHNLQSQMFSEIKTLSKNKMPDALTLDRLNALKTTRNALNEDLIGSLKSMDENAADMYNLGRAIHREKVSPNFSSPTLANIVEGEVNEISPGSLSRSISNVIKKGGMPAEHSLRNHLAELDNAISRGRALQIAIPTLTGAAVGEYASPGFGGLLSGAGAGLGFGGLGSIASKLGGPTIAGITHEPWIRNWIKRLAPVYYGGGRAGIGIAQENR